MNKNITIYDIAREAKVSPGTVSRHINGVGKSRGDTAARIDAAIEKLHYTPNRNARALKNKKTNQICLAYPESDNPFFFDLVKTIETELKKKGFMLMIHYTHGISEEELRILRLTHENIMDGLILINFNYTKEHFQAFKQVKCPLVISSLCVSSYGGTEEDKFDYVGIDVEDAVYKSTMHMIQKGHKKIAFIGGDKNLCVFEERYRGYCRALTEAGIPIREEYCLFGRYDEDAGYEAGFQIGKMADRPTAICAVSDIIAIGCIRALQEQQISIPGDIAIIGMDDIGFDKALNPKLSSVKMMQDFLGKCAVDMILARINGDRSQSKKIIYQPELVERESSSIVLSQGEKKNETKEISN